MLTHPRIGQRVRLHYIELDFVGGEDGVDRLQAVVDAALQEQVQAA